MLKRLLLALEGDIVPSLYLAPSNLYHSLRLSYCFNAAIVVEYCSLSCTAVAYVKSFIKSDVISQALAT